VKSGCLSCVQEKKRRKEQLKFLRKREARTSNDPVFDFSYGE
jgi:hypothetical protein